MLTTFSKRLVATAMGAALLVGTMAPASAAPYRRHHGHRNNGAAVAAGILALGAIGIMAANANRQSRYYYEDGYDYAPAYAPDYNYAPAYSYGYAAPVVQYRRAPVYSQRYYGGYNRGGYARGGQPAYGDHRYGNVSGGAVGLGGASYVHRGIVYGHGSERHLGGSR